MLKKIFFVLSVCFLAIVVSGDAMAWTEGLPKAPGWAEGPEIPWLKGPARYRGPAAGFNEAIEHAKVLNSWGYGARPIEEIKDLLPPEFYAVIADPEKWGQFRVNEIENIPVPEKGTLYGKYMDLTRKHEGKCSLDENGSLMNYVGGRPFPGADPEKDIMKVMWNWEKRYYSDDRNGPFTPSNIDASGNVRTAYSENLLFKFDGRLACDPKPVYKPNPKGINYTFSTPFITPYQVAGTIPLTYRYYAADKPDDMWMYIPAMRRVRRMSTAQRQDRMPFGMNFIWDTNEGFQGKLEKWTWKFIGKKEMLSCAKASCMSQVDVTGHFTGVDQRYHRTVLWIIEGTPDKAVTLSKIKLYIDPEVLYVPYSVNYDIKGRPWFVQYYAWAPDADWMFISHNMISIDVQRKYSTRVPLTYYVTNEGQTAEDYTMQALKAEYLRR